MPIKNYQQLRKTPDLKKQTQTLLGKNLIATISHMRGWRKTMEDAHISEFDIDGKGTHLFAVFDGHGGGQIAIFAKRHLKNLLIGNQWYQKQEYEQALRQVFPDLDALMMKDKGSEEVFHIKQKLEEEIAQEYQHEWEQDSDEQTQCLAGSTAIVCLMTNKTLYIASVGDSQCIISANKYRKLISVEHNPNHPDEKRRIEAAGGKVKNNRVNGLLSMSRSLGDFRYKNKKNRPKDQQIVISNPYIETVLNQNIDFIMLGCDGVWQGKQIDWYFNIIQQKIEKNQSPSHIIESIFDHVVAKDHEGQDGHDNMTAILVLTKNFNQKSGILSKMLIENIIQ